MDTHFYSSERYLKPYDLPVRLLMFKQRKTDLHYHDYYELVIVVEGSGEHCAFGKNYRISAGDVFVLKPGMTHYYRNSQNLVLANVMFDGEILQQDLHDIHDIPGYFTLFEAEPEFRLRSEFKGKHTLDASQLYSVRNILNQLKAESERKGPGYRLAVINLFHQLILFLARSYSNDEKKHSRRMVKLGQMIKFIDENFRQDVSRDDIMAAGAVSISVGSRIFQEFLHETPIGHLIRVRIDHASELLRRTDLPVSEIAFRCGFRDTNYFSLQFKKTTGLSPREFAGRHRN